MNAHPDTMGENNTPRALKGCGVKIAQDYFPKNLAEELRTARGKKNHPNRSFTVSEINAFLHFYAETQDGHKPGRKMNFSKKCQGPYSLFK